MTEDKIAEIRARHEAGPHSKLPPIGDPARAEAINAGWRTFCAEADADRATLLAEVERLTRERDEARAEAEIRPAVYVLLSDDRGIEDLDRQSDEICGCYLSLDAAERAGNELNVRWRIEEYGLEGKS